MRSGSHREIIGHMAEKKPSLEELRAQIDGIDDTIHDLLMDRALIVEQVRHVKESDQPKYRPAREAEILYRLAERHRGSFSKQSILRMWRELIAGTLMLEGPFFVAVQAPNDDDGYMDLARDHFGTFSPMIRHQTSVSVIEDVSNGNATVGVLPFPERDSDDTWWRYLANGDEDRPMVVCRLPFAGRSNARGGKLDALVLSMVPPTETGHDVTVFAFTATGQISNSRLKSAFNDNGLNAGLIMDWPMLGGEYRLFMVELDGFIPGDDHRLSDVMENLERKVDRLSWLGAYALPLTDAELNVSNAVRRGIDRRRKKRDIPDRRSSDHGVENRRVSS